MTVQERVGDLLELATRSPRMVAEHHERGISGDALAGHQDALRPLDHRAPLECLLESPELCEALARRVQGRRHASEL